MDKGKKRERNVNFSREETENIVSLVERYKHVIENKKSDAIAWQEKEKAWKAIEAEFNSTGTGTFRDAKHLKIKYESLKRDTRRKSRLICAERYNTGGGVTDAPPLTPVEQKVKEMILLSVEGGDSIYDSDPLEVPASEEFVECTEGENDTVNLEVPMTDTDTADSKRKEKRPFDKLAEEKLEIVILQKKLIEEELEEKCFKKQMMKNEMELKKQMMTDEMEHKKELYKLEREELLLKIEILKSELENKKKL